MSVISEKDRSRLRDLAKEQAELAASPDMAEKRALWYRHNDCEHVRPMVVIELGTFRSEVVPPLLQCEGERARQIETSLLSNTFNAKYFQDDFIVPDHVGIGTGGWLKLFNHNDDRIVATDREGRQSVGHQFIHLIHDLEEDYDKIQPSVWGWDKDGAQAQFDFWQDLVGDILPVCYEGNSLYSVPTQKLVHMMGMETMYYALCDCPELFVQLLERLADDTLAYFDFLEANHLILPTRDFQWLGQGSYCATRRLPDQAEEHPLTVHDIWGYMDSQEMVGVAPGVYEELVFPAYRRIAERFGALSYGCCEPVHAIWDNCLSKLDNLRRVSVSAWCDEGIMGERLRGKPIVYHRKLNANFIGVGDTLDEAAVRDYIRATLKAAPGCEIEFTQRDVYTVNNDIEKVRRYVQIIREESEKHRY